MAELNEYQTMFNGYTQIDKKYYLLERVFKDINLKNEYICKRLGVNTFDIDQHYKLLAYESAVIDDKLIIAGLIYSLLL